jgi:hypothetical protein
MSRFRDDGALHPSEGARFLFELESSDQQSARYRAAIYTPERRFEYGAVLGMDGSWELTARGERPDDELEDKLDIIARLIARGAAKRVSDQLPPWPQRVLRWRGPGR